MEGRKQLLGQGQVQRGSLSTRESALLPSVSQAMLCSRRSKSVPGNVPHITGAVLEGFLEEVGLQFNSEGWERFGKEGVLGEGVIWGRRSSKDEGCRLVLASLEDPSVSQAMGQGKECRPLGSGQAGAGPETWNSCCLPPTGEQGACLHPGGGWGNKRHLSFFLPLGSPRNKQQEELWARLETNRIQAVSEPPRV